jgi:phosphoribosylglycinamide formyltransferase-1
MNRVRIGVLVSGRGSNLQAVIDNIEQGRLAAEIAVVISDQADAYSLERARKHNIPAVHVSAKDYKGKRDAYDALLVQEPKTGGGSSRGLHAHHHPGPDRRSSHAS